jgi:glucosamine-6-phosphate deaminase
MGTVIGRYGETSIVLCESYEALGEEAAASVAECIGDVLKAKPECRIVFSAAVSQGSFIKSLATKEVDWAGVTCFNIDDFWQPGMPLAFSCGAQTRTELYEKVPVKAAHQVDVHAAEAEADRFEALLREAPPDIMCLGVGTSGHIALNEPGQTSFGDERWVRVVDVDEQSKRQLMEDPNFRALGRIPEKGITTTIPGILSASHFFVMVPLAGKRAILRRLMETEEPTEALPASILRRVRARMFVDRESWEADGRR